MCIYVYVGDVIREIPEDLEIRMRRWQVVTNPILLILNTPDWLRRDLFVASPTSCHSFWMSKK